MFDLKEFCAMQEQLIAAITAEADALFCEFVQPHWKSDTKWEEWKCAFALYGYIMWCFSYIDVLSCYRAGTDQDNQSPRMIKFICDYMKKGQHEAEAAINLWRHTLMHTSKPRRLHRQNGTAYWYLLHWREPNMPHFELVGGASGLDLNVTLFGLLEDLRSGTKAFLADLGSDPTLQANAAKFEARLESLPYRERL